MTVNSGAPGSLPAADLAETLHHARPAFETMRDSRVFVTGGTGFFGLWLLESLLHASRELNLNVHCTALTRNAGGFAARAPHLASAAGLTLIEGDVRSFSFPPGKYTHIVHAATDSSAGIAAPELADVILNGTARVLEFARRAGTRRLLFVSSGAVYGRGIRGTTPTREDEASSPDPLDPRATYDLAKRMAEHLCLIHTQGTALEAAIARPFAFVGPHLPLEGHFAIGNFIGDAIAGRPIHIRGDGTPLRSFLYMSDLAAWLWTMLAFAPAGRAFNVGSDQPVSIADLARFVAATLRPGLPVRIDGTPDPAAQPSIYVPDTSRARLELALSQRVALRDAVLRTAAWHSYSPGG